AIMDKEKIYLVESKHSKGDMLPSIEDIKDGLIKMILFTNLKEVLINNVVYIPFPVLKITSNIRFDLKKLSLSKIEWLKLLIKESNINSFDINIDGKRLREYDL
ncbi:MAG: hypothetical protein N2738_00510, partial [Thermodesulfovibrionales bacterium]|nr:hypothetical protein [Thermodesulfovibrionales bacterium]